jgi:hypothetical protein
MHGGTKFHEKGFEHNGTVASAEKAYAAAGLRLPAYCTRSRLFSPDWLVASGHPAVVSAV